MTEQPPPSQTLAVLTQRLVLLEERLARVQDTRIVLDVLPVVNMVVASEDVGRVQQRNAEELSAICEEQRLLMRELGAFVDEETRQFHERVARLLPRPSDTVVQS